MATSLRADREAGNGHLGSYRPHTHLRTVELGARSRPECRPSSQSLQAAIVDLRIRIRSRHDLSDASRVRPPLVEGTDISTNRPLGSRGGTGGLALLPTREGTTRQ